MEGADMMSADNSKWDIPDEVIESFARCILPSIRAYFDSEEGKREFAEWQAEKKKAEAAKARQQ